MRVTCELIGHSFEMRAAPQRIVSLVSAATETLALLGCDDRLIGVSPYCARYVDRLEAPVVGDYLKADIGALCRLAPDLVLLTTGVQLPLARRCAAAGLPAFALPVPASRFGIVENVVAVGALVDRLPEARALADALEAEFAGLRRVAGSRPRVYAELWFGRHPRTAGGRSFVHDLIELAGGDNIFAADPRGYPPLDLLAVEAARPDVLLLFSEPEYPVDPAALLAERGWDRLGLRAVASTVDRGRSLIHDGPSYAATAAWLAGQLRCGPPGDARCAGSGN